MNHRITRAGNTPAAPEQASAAAAYLLQALALVIALTMAFPVLGDNLTATVDRNRVAENETLTLSVRYDGQVMGEPDFSALEQDFEVLSNQRQSQLSFVNGNSESYTQWLLTLLPRKKGKLTIPTLHFKGQTSDAIRILVEAQPVNHTGTRPVFTETELDKNSVYVQEQALLTLRLYTSVMLNNFNSSDLQVDNARLTKVHESQYQKLIDGNTYTVLERRYGIFPEASGKLKIPEVRFGGVVPERNDPYGGLVFNRGGKRVFVNSEAKTLTVKPRPAHVRLDEWLPSKGLSLAQRWSRPKENLVVGEPITRSIIISAQGLTGAQLPSLQLTDGDGYRIYPDQPTIEDNPTESGVVGTRIESVALVPTRPGTLTLPPLTLKWWDTVSNEVRETTLEGQTLAIAPAPDTGQLPEAGESPGMVTGTETTGIPAIRWNPLTLASLAINVLLLILLLILYFRRGAIRATSGNPDGGQAVAAGEDALFKAVKQSAGDARPADFRENVIRWSRAFWQTDNIHTLTQVTDRAADPELGRLFEQLDKTLYGGANVSPPDLESTLQCLTRVRRAGPDVAAAKPGELAPLYPK